MKFNPNSGFLYMVAAVIILFVIIQSLFFLIRSYKRAKVIGMDMNQIRKIIASTAIFTIAPAVSILLGVLTLSKFLGLPLPWIRLSVIGAITYELPAATTAANTMHIPITETIGNAKCFAVIAWVMTLGIMPSLVLVPLLLKRIQNGLLTLKKKDNKWGDLFLTAMFLGMISAFSGMVFMDVREGLRGWIPIFVLLFSALVMAVCGMFVKVFKVNWLYNYAMPISMLSAMAFAAIITPIIG